MSQKTPPVLFQQNINQNIPPHPPNNHHQRNQVASNQLTAEFYASNETYHHNIIKSDEAERLFHKEYFEKMLNTAEQLQSPKSYSSMIEQSSILSSPSAYNKETKKKQHYPAQGGGPQLESQINEILEAINKLNHASSNSSQQEQQQSGRQSIVTTTSMPSHLTTLKSPINGKQIVSPLKKFLSSVNKTPNSKSTSQLKQQSSRNAISQLTTHTSAVHQANSWFDQQSSPRQPISQSYYPRHSIEPNSQYLSPFRQQNITSVKSQRLLKSPTDLMKHALAAYSVLTQQKSAEISTDKMNNVDKLLKKKKQQYEDNEFINQDLLTRIFANHKKYQEVREQRKYIQRQQEMQEVKEKPSISPTSRQIAKNSARFSKPIYSPVRYQQEIDQYLSKKEEAARLKYLNQREKELEEEEEMQKYSVHKNDKKLSKLEFLRKYQNQVKNWETRVNGGGIDHLESNPDVTFKPQINQRSKQLASNIEKLENRVQQLQIDKMKRVQDILTKVQPRFEPEINQFSQKIASERMSIQPKKANKVPLLSQYITQKLVPQNEVQSLKKSHSGLLITQNKKVLAPKLSKQDTTPNKSSTQLLVRDRSKIKDFAPLLSKSKSRYSPYQQPQKLMSNLQSDEWLNPGTTGPTPPLVTASLQSIEQKDVQQSQYVHGMLSSTQNLQVFLQNYLRDSVDTQSNPIESCSNDDVDILKEYKKLKQEFDDQISNREVKQKPQLKQAQRSQKKKNETPIQSSLQSTMIIGKGQMQIASSEGGDSRLSQTMGGVQRNCSILNDSPIRMDQFDSSQANSEQNQYFPKTVLIDKLRDSSSYAIEFAGTLGGPPESKNLLLPISSSNYSSSQHQFYQSMQQNNGTITSSCDTQPAVDDKNQSLSSLQALFPKSIKNLYKNNSPQKYSKNSQDGGILSNFQNQRRSNEGVVEETESMISSIKQSIELIANKIQQPAYQVDEVEELSEEDSSFLQEIKTNNVYQSSPRHIELSTMKLSPMLIEDQLFSQYLDQEALTYLQLIAQPPPPQALKKQSLNNTEKQTKVINRLVESNRKRMHKGSLLSIPEEIQLEIEEQGLDTVEIIKAVIKQFQHVFQK